MSIEVLFFVLALFFIGLIVYSILSIKEEISFLSVESLKKDSEYVYRERFTNLNVNMFNAINFSFLKPEKSAYWHFSLFKNEKCVKTFSSNSYISKECLENINIIIGNNSFPVRFIENESKKNKNSTIRTNTQVFKIEDGIYDIIFENFFTKKYCNTSIRCKEVRMRNIYNVPIICQDKVRESFQIFENLSLYRKYVNFTTDVKIFEICHSRNLENISFVSERFVSGENSKIFTVNHFKSRAAVFSFVSIYNCKTGMRLKRFLTGVKTNSILDEGSMEIRILKIPKNTKVIVIENIFCYSEYPSSNNIIPMCIKI